MDDRFGNEYWQVYDPFQDCTLPFDAEHNVLIWLEEQHYPRSQQNLWNIG